jgi:hypothetical protein
MCTRQESFFFTVNRLMLRPVWHNRVACAMLWVFALLSVAGEGLHGLLDGHGLLGGHAGGGLGCCGIKALDACAGARQLNPPDGCLSGICVHRDAADAIHAGDRLNGRMRAVDEGPQGQTEGHTCPVCRFLGQHVAQIATADADGPARCVCLVTPTSSQRPTSKFPAAYASRASPHRLFS